MGNIGATEIILILIIALVVFGPRRLPEIGRTVGKSLREFRKASQDLRDEFQFSLDDDEPPMVRSQPRPEPQRRPETKETGPEGQTPVIEAKPPVAPSKPPRAKPAPAPRTRRPRKTTSKTTTKKPERPA
jgi:sec-independent protein translocase protein TatA